MTNAEKIPLMATPNHQQPHLVFSLANGAKVVYAGTDAVLARAAFDAEDHAMYQRREATDRGSVMLAAEVK